jgi:hypothetical protein
MVQLEVPCGNLNLAINEQNVTIIWNAVYFHFTAEVRVSLLEKLISGHVDKTTVTHQVISRRFVCHGKVLEKLFQQISYVCQNAGTA